MALSACGQDSPAKSSGEDPPAGEKGGLPVITEHLPDPNDAYFRNAESCDDYYKDALSIAKKAFEERLEKERSSFLRRKDLEPHECHPKDKSVDDAGGSAGDPKQAADASSTNNQEEGVDEADFVKNDRAHIYLLADGAFQVVDAWPAREMRLISKTEIPGEPKKMFVHEDRAFIYSSGERIGRADPVFRQAFRRSECTYGYDCDFVGDGRELLVTELDISDLREPRVIRRSKIQGSLLGARRIGDRLYTVVVHPNLESRLGVIPSTPDKLKRFRGSCGSAIPYTKDEIIVMFDSRKAEGLQKLASTSPDALTPRVEDEIWDEANQRMQDVSANANACNSMLVSQSTDSTNLISILSTDMHQPAPYRRTQVYARPGAVYASGAHLYLASRHYSRQMGNSWWYPEDPKLRDATSIHRFDLYHQEKKVRYVGSGRVKGRILNQFSLSHKDAHIRVATTTGKLPSLDTHNSLSILGPRDGELKLSGMVDDIAPSEDIRSVRFRGDKGYIVTFKDTDPLFVFDLSDPTAPTIEGELKIPGFSTYMHPMGEDHLLTVGYATSEESGPTIVTGIALQIMDVSNPNDPRLIHKEVIGTRGSTSSAATNHLAFNYYTRRKLLALPMVVCEGGGKNLFESEMTFNGLLVYDVTAQEGFSRRGGLALTLDKHAKDELACRSWWANGLSPVKRSVFMEDYVYAISDYELKVASSKDPSKVLETVELR